MSTFKKWILCRRTESPNSLEAKDENVSAETALNDHIVVIPKYWIHYENKAQTVALRIHLPGCSIDMIKVMIWNTTPKHVLVRALTESRLYKLDYEFPHGAQLLCKRFEADKQVLTCRFNVCNPKCIGCNGLISTKPFIIAENLFASCPDLISWSVFEEVEPQFWITYAEGKKTALFQAHLKGIKSPSQIDFRIHNYQVMIQAYVNPDLLLKLEVRLCSSVKPGWKTKFFEQFEMFMCSIPLLGHFACCECTASMCPMNARANPEVNGQVYKGPMALRHLSPRHSNEQQVRKDPFNETPSASICFEDSSDTAVVPDVDGSDTVEILPTDTILTVD